MCEEKLYMPRGAVACDLQALSVTESGVGLWESRPILLHSGDSRTACMPERLKSVNTGYRGRL